MFVVHLSLIPVHALRFPTCLEGGLLARDGRAGGAGGAGGGLPVRDPPAGAAAAGSVRAPRPGCSRITVRHPKRRIVELIR